MEVFEDIGVLNGEYNENNKNNMTELDFFKSTLKHAVCATRSIPMSLQLSKKLIQL